MKHEMDKLRELREPASSRDLNGGVQYFYGFKNGRMASVVCHDMSYGHEEGLLELAVLGAGGSYIDYSTHITDDVMGHLTAEEVVTILEEIEKLAPKIEGR
jgi:hypothetical protein